MSFKLRNFKKSDATNLKWNDNKNSNVPFKS